MFPLAQYPKPAYVTTKPRNPFRLPMANTSIKFWTTVYRVSLTVLIVLLVFGLCSIFIPLIRENRERERKVAALEEELRAKQDAIVHIRRQQELFQTDPSFVEKIAREELGKAKPGEIIYRFTK